MTHELDMPRGVLYRNYDLYEAPGVDGKTYTGPGGSLYQNMDKYKSVKDFLNKSRKRKKRMRKRALKLISLAQEINEKQEDINNIDNVADEYMTDFVPFKDHPYINGMTDYIDNIEKDYLLFPQKE